MLDNNGFNLWANDYDKQVNISEENNEYPFAGYKDVLNYIYNQVREQSTPDVLDIGFGTGVLTAQLYNIGCNITGIDFSRNMIDIAKKKMPDALLVNWDFTKGLPEEIKNCKFDYIISTYALHHLTDEEKIRFIKSLLNRLNANGKILVGDVSFETKKELKECNNRYKEIWDNDEVYFAADELKMAFADTCYCTYNKISHCAGVLTLTNR